MDDDDDTPDTSRSEITRNLAAGDYTVEATTFEAGETGSFTLTVSGLGGTAAPGPSAGECEQAAQPADGTVTGTWAAGCESEARTGSYARYYTFTLGEDSDVTITLARTSGGGRHIPEPVVRQQPDGETPWMTTTTRRIRSRSEITRNLAAGDYTVEATTFEAGETGSFTLTVSGLGGTAAPGPSAGETDRLRAAAPGGDGTVTGTWAAGCESEARTGSYARYYTFTLDQDSDVTITLARTSGEADTYLNLWSGSSRTGTPRG